MLDRDPESVEEFVEHLAILSRINNELPALEREFHTVTRLFTIANDFNLKIDPEQYAFYKSLGSTFHHLKVGDNFAFILISRYVCKLFIYFFQVELALH